MNGQSSKVKQKKIGCRITYMIQIKLYDKADRKRMTFNF